MSETPQTDPTIIDTLSANNLKTIGEAGSFAIATLMQEMAASAARRNNLADAALGSQLKRMSELDVQEGTGEQLTAGAALPNAMTDLASVIAAIQQIMKGAQTTPPATP